MLEYGSKIAEVLDEGFQVVVGRGDRARLWEDIKLEGVRLKEVYPMIFSLVSNKHGNVNDYGS